MVTGIFRHPEQVFEFMTVRRREREREEKKEHYHIREYEHSE
jgi:hypothetical protein